MNDRRFEGNQDDRTALAGSLALALLSESERAEAEQLAATDPAFAAEVDLWQRRLGLLPTLLPPVMPPSGSLEAVMKRINGSSGVITPSASFPAKSRSGAGAAALGFLGGLAFAAALTVVVLRHGSVVGPSAPAPIGVAMLTPREGPATFVVFYDADRHSLTVAPTAPWSKVDRVPELWLSAENDEPVSIGRINTDRPTRINLPAGLAAHLSDAAVLVITSEEEKGDQAGPVRGPVVAHGPLVRV